LVPRDWNSQAEKLFYYEGTLWYRRRFDGPAVPRVGVTRAVRGRNYEADVYLNGTKLGRHVGGFTPFAFEVTSLLKPKANSLIVRVNNTRHVEGVPTVNTDWWNYGGLTRDVRLLAVPETFIQRAFVHFRRGQPPGPYSDSARTVGSAAKAYASFCLNSTPR